MPQGRLAGDHAPEFKHVDDMEWEMGRFNNRTKFLFHPRLDRPTEPNPAFCGTSPGRAFPSTDTTSHKCSTSSRASSTAAVGRMGQERSFTCPTRTSNTR